MKILVSFKIIVYSNHINGFFLKGKKDVNKM